jgi:hypothetical protein
MQHDCESSWRHRPARPAGQGEVKLKAAIAAERYTTTMLAPPAGGIHLTPVCRQGRKCQGRASTMQIDAGARWWLSHAFAIACLCTSSDLAAPSIMQEIVPGTTCAANEPGSNI